MDATLKDKSVIAVASALALGLPFGISAQTTSPELVASLEALRAGDCSTVGELINKNLDASGAMKILAGVLREEGLCVERDIDSARRYYEAAEPAKDWGSAMRIGLSYALGEGVNRSYSKAGAWLEKSRDWQGKPPTSNKMTFASLPATEITPATEWSGYIVSVYFLGANGIKYPLEAKRLGAEGEYRVRVCVVSGSVAVTPERVEPSPAAGTARVVGRRELTQAIDDAYAHALAVLPRPDASPPKNVCFTNPISFKLR